MVLLQMLLATLPFGDIASSVLRLIWPTSPDWLGSLVGELVTVTKDLVEELTGDEYQALSGRSKFETVVIEVREALDEAFDEVPEWSDLGEEARDRIIGGVAEFVLFVFNATESKKQRRGRRLRLRNRVLPS